MTYIVMLKIVAFQFYSQNNMKMLIKFSHPYSFERGAKNQKKNYKCSSNLPPNNNSINSTQ